MEVELLDDVTGGLLPGCIEDVSFLSGKKRTTIADLSFVVAFNDGPTRHLKEINCASKLRWSKSAVSTLQLKRVVADWTFDGTSDCTNVEVLIVLAGVQQQMWHKFACASIEDMGNVWALTLSPCYTPFQGMKLIVDKANVRLANPEVPSFDSWYAGADMTAVLVPIPRDIHDACLSTWSSFAEELWAKSGLFQIKVVRGNKDQEDCIRLVGWSAGISAAEQDIGHHFKSLYDSAASQERRNRRLRLLEERRSTGDQCEQCELFVHESIVGLVIGKQGDNLSRIARANKVEIRVFPDENGVRRLRLYGSDTEKVNLSRSELDYLAYKVMLPKNSMGLDFQLWLSDASQKVVRDLAQKHNVHSIWFDEAEQAVTVCGLSRSIEGFLNQLSDAYKNDVPLKGTTPRYGSSPLLSAKKAAWWPESEL